MNRYVRLPLVPIVAVVILVCCGRTNAGAGSRDTERAHTVAPVKPRPPAECIAPDKLGDAVLTVDDLPTGFGEVPALNPENAIRLGGGNVSSISVPFPTLGTVFRGFQQGTQSLIAGPYVADTAILLKKPKDASKALKAFRDAAAVASPQVLGSIPRRPTAKALVSGLIAIEVG